MSTLLMTLTGSLPALGPVVLAFLLASAGSLASRRWRRIPNVWAAIGAGVGWAALAPAAWRWILWPRTTLAFLILPAFIFALADLVRLRVSSRWIGAAAVCFAAWWMANAPMGRPQFWRVGFAGLMAAWVLGRVGANEPRMALGVALTAWLGLVMGGATANWEYALAILVVVAAAVWLGGRNGAVPLGLTMVGLVGAELGGGRLMRGSVAAADVACLASFAAPLLIPGVERGLRRRLGRAAPVLAPIIVALGLAALAWLVSRAMRG